MNGGLQRRAFARSLAARARLGTSRGQRQRPRTFARHPRLGAGDALIQLAYFVAEHEDHDLAR